MPGLVFSNTGPALITYFAAVHGVAFLTGLGGGGKPPTSRKAMRAVQEVFNTWAAQSGQPFNVISRVLAQSIG